MAFSRDGGVFCGASCDDAFPSIRLIIRLVFRYLLNKNGILREKIYNLLLES